MSCSPSTPAKAPFTTAAVAHASSGTKSGKLPTQLEPSPASTFGETPPSGSQIAITPNDDYDIGFGRIQQHDVPQTSTNEGSPLAYKVGPYRMPTRDRHAQEARRVPYNIPAVLQKLENLRATIGSQKHANNDRLKTYQDAETRAVINVPQKQRFVKRDDASKDDDPFTGDGPRMSVTPTRLTKSANTTPTKQRILVTHSVHTTPTSASKKSKKAEDAPSAVKVTPRSDRAGDAPSADNAQALFSPHACVFVANLTMACDDVLLEAAVTSIFQKFGKCYTKVRRDHRSMPFAFVQYEENSIAELAVVAGRGKVIEGRPCRTEMARAARSLYVSNFDGTIIDPDLIKPILEPYGAIEKNFPPSETEIELFRLPRGGRFFRFAIYQDCIDATARLRNHPEYRFEQRGEPKEELASRLANRKNKTEDDTESPGARRQSAISASPRAVSNTIWVGNLPPDVSYGMLTSIFASFGTVISTHMVVQHLNHKRRHDAVELVTNAYAYVEFDHPSSAVAAVKAVHNRSTALTGKPRLQVMYAQLAPTPDRPRTTTRPMNTSPPTWGMPGLMHAQQQTLHAYSPGMTPFSGPMSFYNMSAGTSTPMSELGMQSPGYPPYGHIYAVNPAYLAGNQGQQILQHAYAAAPGPHSR